LKAIIDDKKEQEQNQQFVKKAIKDTEVRALIVKHYQDLISEENENHKRHNQSLAL
jgi:hypothetical protein